MEDEKIVYKMKVLNRKTYILSDNGFIPSTLSITTYNDACKRQNAELQFL